jgi:hypothetical protein
LRRIVRTAIHRSTGALVSIYFAIRDANRRTAIGVSRTSAMPIFIAAPGMTTA